MPPDAVGQADRSAQRLPELRLQGPDGQMAAVTAAIDAVAGEGAGQLVGGVRSGQAPGSGQGHQRGHAREQRDVDDLALARTLPRLERGQDADRRHERTRHVRHLGQGQHRPALAVAVASEEAAHGEVVDVVAGARRVGALLPVAGERAVDEAGVLGEQRLRTEAPASQRAGPERFEKDVGARGQAPHDLDALGRAQVHRQRALVAVERGMRRAVFTERGRQRAGRITERGLLHLHHVGPQVPQQHRAVGAGDVAAEIEHADAFEGRRHRFKINARAPSRSPCLLARRWRGGRNGPGAASARSRVSLRCALPSPRTDGRWRSTHP